MKKTWNTPQLIVYGPVKELTQKTVAFGDAFIFQDDDDDGPAGNSL